MPRGVLLDIAGVLTDGSKAIPGAVTVIAKLAEAGLPFRYVTNTTSKPKRRVLEALAAAGFPAEDRLLFTPVAAARSWLTEHGYSPHLLTNPDLAEDFTGLDPSLPQAVVVGDAGEGFTYEALNDAFRLILDGAPLLALAMNRRFTASDGRITLDAGAFVAALTYGSGAEPVVFGKPAPGFYAAACADIGCAPAEAVMIGDDAEADVAGALSAGIGRGILVQTGKYRAGDETAFAPQPSAVVKDINAAIEMLLATP